MFTVEGPKAKKKKKATLQDVTPDSLTIMATAHSYSLDLSMFHEYSERALSRELPWIESGFLSADFDDISSASHSLVDYPEDSILSPSEDLSSEPSTPSSESYHETQQVIPITLSATSSLIHVASRNSSGLAPSFATLPSGLSDNDWRRNSSGLSNSLLEAASSQTTPLPAATHIPTAVTIASSDAKEQATQRSLAIYSTALKLDARNGVLAENTPGSGDFVFDLENHSHRLELQHSFALSLIEGASAGEENAIEVSAMDLRCLASTCTLDFDHLTPFLFVRRREMRPENDNYYSIRTRTSSMVTFVFIGGPSYIYALMHKKLELFNDVSSFDNATSQLYQGALDALLVNISLRDATASAKLKPHVNSDNEIDFSVKSYRLPHTNQYAVAFEFPMTAADTTMRNLNGQRELFVDAHFVLPNASGAAGVAPKSRNSTLLQCHPAIPTHPGLHYACADCFIKVDIQPGMVKRGGRDVKTLPCASHTRGPSVSPTPMTTPLIEIEKKEVVVLSKKKERIPRKRAVQNSLPPISPQNRRVQRPGSRPLFDDEDDHSEQYHDEVLMVDPAVGYGNGMVYGYPHQASAAPSMPHMATYYTPMYQSHMMAPAPMHQETMRSTFVFTNEWEAAAYGLSTRMYASHQQH